MTRALRVLVVEDDTWQAEQHVRTLQAQDIDASYVIHGLAAIDAIDQSPPDVIVLDVFLAGPNGLTLLHELRSHDDIGMIPVVVCSNSAADITLKNLTPYGVVCLLDKATMTPNELVVAVKRAAA